MTTDHVYYHDLFKRGKVELLRHIKRKHSEHQGLYPSPYDGLQSYNINTAEISQENLMLKKLNQRAFSKISSLEAKMCDLKSENEKLLQKFSDKQRKEEMLGTAFTDYFQPKGSIQSLKLLPNDNLPYNSSHYLLDKDNDFHLSKDYDQFSTNNKTPDTSLTSDAGSNIDSYLNLEATEAMVSSDYTSSQQANFSNINCVNMTYNEDTVLQKRKFMELDSDLYLCLEGQEPNKIPCLGNFEEEQKHAFPEIEFPILFDSALEERC